MDGKSSRHNGVDVIALGEVQLSLGKTLDSAAAVRQLPLDAVVKTAGRAGPLGRRGWNVDTGRWFRLLNKEWFVFSD